MNPLLVVAILAAGATGALLRFLTTQLFTRVPRATPTAHPANTTNSASAALFPWPVLVVNIVGSAIGGAVLGLHTAEAVSPEWTLILLTGLCGGLTTFSTFTVETVQLARAGLARVAVANIVLNLGLGLATAGVAFSLVVTLATNLV